MYCTEEVDHMSLSGYGTTKTCSLVAASCKGTDRNTFSLAPLIFTTHRFRESYEDDSLNLCHHPICKWATEFSHKITHRDTYPIKLLWNCLFNTSSFGKNILPKMYSICFKLSMNLKISEGNCCITCWCANAFQGSYEYSTRNMLKAVRMANNVHQVLCS